MRRGLQDGGSYGFIDRLIINHDGYRLKRVYETVENPTYAGAFNFVKGPKAEFEYEYDKNGNLVKDINKKISKIEYNLLNLPQLITYENGNRISFSYDLNGTKRKVEYTSVSPANKHIVEYIENMIYEDGVLKQLLVDGGYVSFEEATPTYHFYLNDHLGNCRVVVNQNAQVEQVNHYYPYGGLMAESTGQEVQRRKYNGKELDRMFGLDWYDYGARWYDAALCQWLSVDAKADKYPFIAYNVYCLDNPINAIDPDGKETHVKRNADGTFTILGGILNKDRNIYVYTQDKNGNFTIKGKSIGRSSSITSFYDSDKNEWREGAVINPFDQSGRKFLNKMVSSAVTLDDYIDKARNGHPYDFKVTNGGNKVISNSDNFKYRGMMISYDKVPIYSSARDIGNMAAGIVAAKNGISWTLARGAFDAYQSYSASKVQFEGLSTVSAEKYGWLMIKAHTNGIFEAENVKATVKSFDLYG